MINRCGSSVCFLFCGHFKCNKVCDDKSDSFIFQDQIHICKRTSNLAPAEDLIYGKQQLIELEFIDSISFYEPH